MRQSHEVALRSHKGKVFNRMGIENTISMPDRAHLGLKLKALVIQPTIQPFTTILTAAVLIGGLCIGGGAAARYAIPIISTIAAYLLSRTSAKYYINYVWWVSFLACFVRRCSDYRTAYTEGNLILAAPSLAVVPAAVLLWRSDVWQTRELVSFRLAGVVVLYGVLLGVWFIPLKALATATLSWTVPIVFGLYTYAVLRDEDLRQDVLLAMQRSFAWGLIIMGGYGIWQYVTGPAWDMLWITGSGIGSVGTAEPYGFRVFSTMNGPGALAITLVAGLVWIIGMRGIVPLIAGIMGLIALLLTSVRAAWLALVVSAVFYVYRERKRMGRLIAIATVGGVCIACAMLIDPIREFLQPRFESFINLGDDTSYQERQGGYAQMTNYVLHEPFGSGLGSMEALYADKTSLGTRDSGLLDSLLSVGWLGATTYLFALGLITWRAWPRLSLYSDFHLSSACIVLGLLTQLFFGVITVGVGGILIWSFAAVALSERSVGTHERVL